MVLTDKQKHDLHVAIFDYLSSEVHEGAFSSTLEAFSKESSLSSEAIESGKGKGLLEKKWTSVIRLQKKVMELEGKLAAKSEHGQLSNSSSEGGQDSRRLPRGPAKGVLSGHRGPINSVSVHPVYSLVASASEDCMIKLWDYETIQYERTLKGHTGSVTCVSFSPSGSMLASTSTDMTVKLWDMSSFQCTKTLRGHDHTVSFATFTPSGDHIFSCARDQSIKYWEVSSGFALRTFTGHTEWVKSLAVSPDGNILASGSSDHNVIVWKIESGSQLQTLRGHEHVVESVALCNGIQLALESSKPAVTAKAEKHDVLYCASGSRDGSVRLWDALKGIELSVFKSHENWVRCVMFHKSGKYIISCSDDKSIRVYDMKEGRCVRTIANAHDHFVSSVACTPNNAVLISGSVDKKICIWNCS